MEREGAITVLPKRSRNMLHPRGAATAPIVDIRSIRCERPDIVRLADKSKAGQGFLEDFCKNLGWFRSG